MGISLCLAINQITRISFNNSSLFFWLLRNKKGTENQFWSGYSFTEFNNNELAMLPAFTQILLFIVLMGKDRENERLVRWRIQFQGWINKHLPCDVQLPQRPSSKTQSSDIRDQRLMPSNSPPQLYASNSISNCIYFLLVLLHFFAWRTSPRSSRSTWHRILCRAHLPIQLIIAERIEQRTGHNIKKNISADVDNRVCELLA